MKISETKILFLILLSTIVLWQCRPQKHLTQDESLLIKNKINVTDNKINKEIIKQYIKQKPNKKVFGFFRFHLWIHNISYKKKDKNNQGGLGEKLGEAPVIYNSLYTDKTIRQLELFLNHKGYFNSKLSTNVRQRNNKTTVSYIIETGKAYTINNITYKIQDRRIHDYINIDTSSSLLKSGNNYDVDILQKERSRINRNLKNNGYYNFKKDYITYKVDSSAGNKKIDIQIDVNNSHSPHSDSAINKSHKQYTINRIYIYPDYNPLQNDSVILDTIETKISRKTKDLNPNIYYFVTSKNNSVKYKTITQAIFMENNKDYKLSNVELTYQRLLELGNFKFINIRFIEQAPDSNKSKYSLDCIIQLSKSPIHSFSVETEGTNSEGDMGVAGNIVYQNKNIFKGAEIFNIKLKGALEIQKNTGASDEEVIENLPLFNAIETGINANLKIPKFLIPIRQERFSKHFKPKTLINTGFNYQRNPRYKRYILNASFGYDWKESKYKRHILLPIEINSVKISQDSSFRAIINSLNDERIKNSYRDHLTTPIKYSFIYNNQQIDKQTNFVFFRGNIEFSGHLLNLIHSSFDKIKHENGYFEIFNIRYAQYIRPDIDFRYYWIFNRNNTIAYRVKSGIGFPYGNMDVLPFEKSFFCGGANSIRAWPIRSVGPGSYSNPSQGRFDKTGDIYFETNLEYRFPVYKLFKGALFLDAGNVWLKNKNEQFPNGEFQASRFIDDLAIGSGIGFRLDFTFFIIRFDAAVPIKDPAISMESKWVYKDLTTKDINFNIGIGYPF